MATSTLIARPGLLDRIARDQHHGAVVARDRHEVQGVGGVWLARRARSAYIRAGRSVRGTQGRALIGGDLDRPAAGPVTFPLEECQEPAFLGAGEVLDDDRPRNIAFQHDPGRPLEGAANYSAPAGNAASPAQEPAVSIEGCDADKRRDLMQA